MVHPKPIAAALIAASLAGCGSFGLYDTDTTAAFGPSSKPAWAKPAEPAPEIEPPQSMEALVRSTEVSSRSSEAPKNSLFAAARAVDAKPLDPPKPPDAIKPPQAVGPADAPPQAMQSVPIEARGHTYLFRGMGGLIYSTGMDRLAERINRTGVKASVHTYLMWRISAEEAIRAYRRDHAPITVIGHSAGGDSALAFAERLNAEHVPVGLLVTYDPTRIADDVPPNVERYINLYQSRNIMGGGDVTPGRGFHGNYASVNLREHSEIIHINIEKSERIHEQLVSKIAQLAVTPAAGQGEAVPIRYVVPARAAIELWDSGLPVTAEAGDTLQTLSSTYHVPEWTIAQVNRLSESTQIKPGQRIVIPRHLTPAAPPAGVPVTSVGPNGR